jgi:hypothetical protein
VYKLGVFLQEYNACERHQSGDTALDLSRELGLIEVSTMIHVSRGCTPDVLRCLFKFFGNPICTQQSIIPKLLVKGLPKAPQVAERIEPPCSIPPVGIYNSPLNVGNEPKFADHLCFNFSRCAGYSVY